MTTHRNYIAGLAGAKNLLDDQADIPVRCAVFFFLLFLYFIFLFATNLSWKGLARTVFAGVARYRSLTSHSAPACPPPPQQPRLRDELPAAGPLL